jgi:hypothetical protein
MDCEQYLKLPESVSREEAVAAPPDAAKSSAVLMPDTWPPNLLGESTGHCAAQQHRSECHAGIGEASALPPRDVENVILSQNDDRSREVGCADRVRLLGFSVTLPIPRDQHGHALTRLRQPLRFSFA